MRKKLFIFILMFVFYFSIPKDTFGESYVNPDRTYTYEFMKSDIIKLSMAYPDLITYKSLGKTPYGRDIWAVGVGKGDATLLINASHHAREWLTTNLTMEMIDQYSSAYKNNKTIDGYSAKEILNETTIWFVPMLNPDGVTLQQSGLKAFPSWSHKSLISMNGGSNNFKRWKANAQGIDLNRQYPAGWSPSRDFTKPYYMNYPGKLPLSAPEAKIMADFTYWADPEITVSYHSSGRILFWHYKVLPQNYSRDYTIAKKVSSMTGYSLVKPSSGGGSGYKDWFIQQFGRPGLTPEISYYVGQTNPPLSVLPEELRRNRGVGLYLSQESNKLWEKKVLPTKKIITTFGNKKALNRPNNSHSSNVVIKEGQYHVNGMKNNFLRIRRDDGDKWIYNSSYVIGTIEKTNERLLLKTNKTTFSMPMTNKNTKQLVKPQILTAKKKWQNWYLVTTQYGDRWITDASVIKNFNPNAVNKTVELKVNKVSWLAPYETSKKTSLPKGTVVTVSKEWNGWICVLYNKKEYWLRNDRTLKMFDINNSTTSSDVTLLLKTDKSLFDLPSFGSSSGKSVSPQIIRAKRSYLNWYQIETDYGLKWINSNSVVVDFSPSDTETDYILSKPKVAHGIPSKSTPLLSIPQGTIVKAQNEWESWVQVVYNQKHYWLVKDSVLSPYGNDSNSVAFNEKLLLKTNKTLFSLPSLGSNTNVQMVPTIVEAVRKKDQWIQIKTNDGLMWITDASVGFKVKTVNQKLTVSSSKLGYTYPGAKTNLVTIPENSNVLVQYSWEKWIYVIYENKGYWIQHQ
ncbi:M14 family metallopeptidase [Metabacillus indicus]|uniref:M14 family metallopeptidase n=1 Tax=Metabacillus indicus TaxID=246786 RepID=UPI0009D668BE|nr:M14 family metallocarboxypeptidase [Metabacillus indicus]